MDGQNTARNLLLLAFIFVSSALSLVALFLSFPELEQAELARVHVPPSNIEDAKELGRLLSRVKETHYLPVLGMVALTYVFLQTFAIPGSISLSILSGFLFPFPVALLLVCACSATGATFCYLLSAMVGKGLVAKYFPQRLHSWRAQVTHHQDDMLWYMMFLRITPFLPNWFINIASPVLGVGLTPFYWGTFLGVAPPSFLFIRAGTTLYELTTTTGHISWTSVLLLTLLAVLSLVPVVFKRCLKNKLD